MEALINSANIFAADLPPDCVAENCEIALLFFVFKLLGRQ